MKIEGIITIILVSCLIVGFFTLMYYKSTYYNNPCLREIAINVCEDKGMIYSWINNNILFCKENERSVDSIRFNFLDSELKQCIKKEAGSW